MLNASLPPGFRFHPTDVELILYYLKRKVMGKRLRVEAISDIDLYKFAPWDLPERACLQSRDLEWYFFCPCDRKYANGSRTNRATHLGYWKTTGKDRVIYHNSQTVGMKKTLVFHIGRAPSGTRTDWIMHEYKLDDKLITDLGYSQGTYVLCKIYEKSGPGPKNGEQYGAPFNEEEWNNDDVEDQDVATSLPLFSHIGRQDVQPSLSDSVIHPVISAAGDVTTDVKDILDVEKVLLQLPLDADNSPGLKEKTCRVMPDTAIHSETLTEKQVDNDLSRIFCGLDDLLNNEELCQVNNLYLPNQADDEFQLQQTLLSFDEGPFLDLKDFEFPVEDHYLEWCWHDPSTPENCNLCFASIPSCNTTTMSIVKESAPTSTHDLQMFPKTEEELKPVYRNIPQQ